MSAGDTIAYSFTVTNTGTQIVTNIALSDEKVTVSGGPIATLAPGASDSATFTAVYALTQEDIDAGTVSNTAVATGSSPSGTDDVSDTSGTAGDNDTPTVVDLGGTASINGVKTVVLSSDTDASGGMSAGDVLTYTITATNSGNVTLKNVGIESDTLSRGVTNLTEVTGFSASDFTLVPENSRTLAPGEFASFKATYVLTEADIGAGGLSNSATVSGTPPTGEPVTDVTDDGATGTGDAGDDPTVSLLQPLARNDASYGNQLGQPGKVAVLENDSYASAMTPTVMLVTDDGAFVTEMTVAGEGVWKVGVNNKIRFTPAAGYFGDPTAVEYVITSSNVPVSTPAEVLIDYLGVATSDDLVAENDEIVGQDPNGPVTVNPLLNDADGNAGQLVASSVRLLDDNNNPVSSLTVPGEGSWSVDTQTGEVTFTPEPGFTGSSARVRYYVENVAGIPQTAEISILFIDPRGVVYDTDTLSPISGVSLQFADATGTVLPASCFPAGQQPQTTGSDGRYRFDLAVSCTTLAGREFQIQITGAPGYMSEPAPEGREQGVLNPGTPATDVHEVVPYDSAPTAAQTRKYFTRFLIGANSRQIVNNHIPLGRLFKEIEEDLRQVLEDDLAATMTQQGQIMSGYAKNALARLRMNSHTVCAAEVDRIFKRKPVSFATGSAKLPKEADQTLDRVARVMERCEEIAFAVHGYVDPASGRRDGYDLSQARANSVIAGLRQRGIIRERLQALPFRLPRSEAGTEGDTESRIRVVSSGRLITDATCADTVTTDDGMNVDINGSSGSIDGNYLQERRNCARDGWTILSGSFSHLRNSNGMNQSMFQLSKRSERFISDDHLSGWFLGAYATSNDVSGLAYGTIRGFGLNAGLYGAKRFDSNLFLDYYFGAAAGRHRFDLAFGRVGGVISATGHYDYTALFMGVALSGQTHLGNYPLTPRVGLDVAWSPGGSVEVAINQGAISDATGLRLPSVSGLKLFSELQFDDLLPGRPATLMAAPRLLCERAIGQQHTECGYGLDLRLAHEVGASDSRYELALTGEHTRARDSYGVSLSFIQALAAGALEGAARVTQDGRPAVGMAYNLDF
ncbi:OmpA family protein [Phaeobacter gallaeciensis]|uniref:OmpA family protein n=1 Tax=Phaeobacter gallaeciensis TaxID=60890 RepID=A0ABD4XGQ2_9RHOB|nr:OmpA family protein [Phaeobacter gallaeciensis]MDE4168247.1 OmpA family protein [Phaeobacter gallaeciensis]